MRTRVMSEIPLSVFDFLINVIPIGPRNVLIVQVS